MILAVDPGLRGGVAILSRAGAVIRTWRMPIEGTRRKPAGYDAPGMAALLREALELSDADPLTAWTEAPANVRIQGRLHATSTAKLAACVGLWRGVLAAHGIELHEVAATTWQAALGLRAFGAATKGAALGYARQRWPGRDWTAATDGEVDACLVAAFGLGQERVLAMGGRR